MATHFTCDDVIELVTGDAWGESEGESDDELDFESDPLDREQEAPNMSPVVDDAQEESMELMVPLMKMRLCPTLPCLALLQLHRLILPHLAIL